MAGPDETATAQDKQLAEEEAGAFAVIGLGIATLHQQTLAALAKLERAADAATASDVRVSAQWVRRSPEYKQLSLVLDAGLSRVRSVVVEQVLRLREHAIRYGVTAASGLSRSAGGTGTALLQGQTELLIDGLDPKRLERLFAHHNERTAAKARQVLVDGVARRRSPQHTAGDLARVLDVPRWQALRVARTEQYRAYREAQRQTWLTDDGVTGWTWVAVLDLHTCGYCYAMHGTVHPLTEQLAGHPGCRCRTMPVTDRTRGRRSGHARFALLAPVQQDTILGPATAAAYRDGLFDLDDLPVVDVHPQWGPTGRTRSLRDLIGDEDRAAYIAAARQR